MNEDDLFGQMLRKKEKKNYFPRPAGVDLFVCGPVSSLGAAGSFGICAAETSHGSSVNV